MRTHGSLTFIVVMSTLLLSTAPSANEPHKVGDKVLPWTLDTINGNNSGLRRVSLYDLVGPEADREKRRKAMIMSFFATYCGPCKKELPFLEALYREYRDRGLGVVVVSIDKDPDQVDALRELSTDITFPVVADRFNIVARRYSIEKLPNLLILDTDAVVAMVNVGYGEGAGRHLLDEVRKALGVPTGEPVPRSLLRFIDPTAGAAVAGDAGDEEQAEGAGPAGAGEASEDEGEPREMSVAEFCKAVLSPLREIWRVSGRGESAEFERYLGVIEDMAPDRKRWRTAWKKIVRKAVKSNRYGQGCASCHRAWRKKYHKMFPDRLVRVPPGGGA